MRFQAVLGEGKSMRPKGDWGQDALEQSMRAPTTRVAQSWRVSGNATRQMRVLLPYTSLPIEYSDCSTRL